jgi:hypothetical protein
MAMPRGTERGGFLRRSRWGMLSSTRAQHHCDCNSHLAIGECGLPEMYCGYRDSDDVAGRELNTRSTPTYSGDVAAQLVWRSCRSVAHAAVDDSESV